MELNYQKYRVYCDGTVLQQEEWHLVAEEDFEEYIVPNELVDFLVGS